MSTFIWPPFRFLLSAMIAVGLVSAVRPAVAGSETAVVVTLGEASRAGHVRKAARAWLEAQGSQVVATDISAGDVARLAQCLVPTSGTCADAIAVTGADRLWLFELEAKGKPPDTGVTIILSLFGADGVQLASDERYCDRCRSETLNAQVEKVLEVVADAALSRKSARTVIRVRTEPAGALVTIDGDPVGTAAPEFEYRVNPGEHEVTVSLARHEPATRRVNLADGEERVLELQLEPYVAHVTDPPPQTAGPRRWLLPSAVGAVGLAAIATGVTLLVLHDPGEEDGRATYYERDRRIPGIAVGAAGAIVCGVSGYLFFRAARQDARVEPSAIVSGRGLSIGVQGRF